MGRWDPDFIDLVVPGYIRFEGDGIGEFQFGTVHGRLRYRDREYRAKRRLFFTWDWALLLDAANGTGYAEIGNSGLRGHFYIQEGDDSRFKAEKSAAVV